jgi:uncharacterized protein YcaQ
MFDAVKKYPMKTGVTRLSLTEARAIALRTQGLADNRAPFGPGKAGALKALRHLGYVQVDTISVIQRAHHHVLWSRVPGYAPEMLHELQSVDVQVFEYWNHASSYLPLSDYRFSLPLMRKYRTQLHWSDESPEIKSSMRRMLARIRKQGPVMLSDIESATLVKGWSEGALSKIERRALHELWMRGEIMIRSRRGMQKVFDLSDRVLPKGTDVKVPTKREAATFHVTRALRALGIARLQELHYLQDSDHARALRDALSRLLHAGEVVEVAVENAPIGTAFALRESLELAGPLERNLVRFLSPFDNLTIQRKRLKWLFDFDYSVEIYVPPARRKYGYFVLPILWGDRLIGRMDAKADRAERLLLIHNLVFEPDFSDLTAVKPALSEALCNFMRFQQCEEWRISRVEPKTFRLTSSCGFLRN